MINEMIDLTYNNLFNNLFFKNFNRFIHTINNDAPVWTTPNTIIFNNKILKLRCFRATGVGQPILISPPQAGHSSHIADFDKNKSMVATILESTENPVYCIEWLSSDPSRRNETVGDWLDALEMCEKTINLGKVILVGLCQGGWLSAMYAAQRPVAGLMLVAAPIDFHAGDNNMAKIAKSISIEVYKAFVQLGGGVMPGNLMLMGWKGMNFIDRYVNDYLKIYSATDDDEVLRKTKKFRDWYENTCNLSGEAYLWIIKWLFKLNQLITGKLTARGEVIDLANIKCPVVMVAGEEDDITLPEQLFALKKYISTDCTYEDTISECGHVGCFMGTKSQPRIAKAIKVLLDFIG